jgi:hypothetical protein
MTKINWLRVSVIGAAIVAASMVVLVMANAQTDRNALKAVNQMQDLQFANMLQAQQNINHDLATLEKQNKELQMHLQSIGRLADSGLSAIAKMRADMRKSHEEIDSMSDDDVNRLILDGLAKYKRQQ